MCKDRIKSGNVFIWYLNIHLIIFLFVFDLVLSLLVTILNIYFKKFISFDFPFMSTKNKLMLM
jgi:hypothetical protein